MIAQYRPYRSLWFIATVVLLVAGLHGCAIFVASRVLGS